MLCLQSSWQIGRPDLNAVFLNVFFFFFFFFSLSSRRVRSESVTALKCGTWFLDEQDTRQNKELKKSVVQSVSLCLSYLFLYIFDKKVHKRLKKKISKQKKFKPWILLNQTRTEKQMRAAALRHRIYFFSLNICRPARQRETSKLCVSRHLNPTSVVVLDW